MRTVMTAIRRRPKICVESHLRPALGLPETQALKNLALGVRLLFDVITSNPPDHSALDQIIEHAFTRLEGCAGYSITFARRRLNSSSVIDPDFLS